MKIIKARYNLLFYFLLPFWTLTTVLYFIRFEYFTDISLFNWLLVIILFVLSLSPRISAITLGQPPPSLVFSKWLVRIFLSQLLLALFVWSSLKIISYPPLTGSALNVLPLEQLSLKSGLFPLGFMLFFALAIGYFTYNQQQTGLVSSTFKPLFGNNHLDSIGIAVDSYMRFIPFFALVFIYAMLILSAILLLQLIIPFKIAIGMEIKVILITSALLFLSAHPLCAKCMHQLTSKGCPVWVVLTAFSLLIVLIYPVVSLISQGLAILNPVYDFAYQFVNKQYQAQQVLMTICLWWLNLSLINGAYIAVASRGRTFRQIIPWSAISFLGVLVVINLLNKTAGKYHLILLPEVLLIASSLVLASSMLHPKNFTYFQRATIPTSEPIKIRPSFRILKTFPLMMVVFLCCYFEMSVSIWSYLSLLGMLPPLIIILISYVALMKQFR